MFFPQASSKTVRQPHLPKNSDSGNEMTIQVEVYPPVTKTFDTSPICVVEQIDTEGEVNRPFSPASLCNSIKVEKRSPDCITDCNLPSVKYNAGPHPRVTIAFQDRIRVDEGEIQHGCFTNTTQTDTLKTSPKEISSNITVPDAACFSPESLKKMLRPLRTSNGLFDVTKSKETEV